MVSLDQLAALDLLLWLTASQRAARLAGTNQSTIIRRSRQVEDCFDVTIERGPEGWGLRGDTQLLAMERRLHQQARLLGMRPLRLQVPYWSQRGLLRQPPAGWCFNPPSASGVCENPVALLRERVIDGCLLTPTQIPERREDLVLVDLHHSRIELAVFHQGKEVSPLAAWRRLRERGGLVLRQMPFLPRTCLERSQDWFAALQPVAPAPIGTQAAAEEDPSVSVAFLTPEMRAVQGLPFVVDPEPTAFPYVERLVMLAEHADQPAFQRLRDQLRNHFAPARLAVTA